jgi:5,10-methylene-tetrahydrofolate dehydrogenase/methenyl tetrahydrofolate cyclohydrolase
VMTATKIDGTATAKEIRESIRAEIENTQKSNPRYKPSLKIIQVGERSDSSKLTLFHIIQITATLKQDWSCHCDGVMLW